MASILIKHLPNSKYFLRGSRISSFDVSRLIVNLKSNLHVTCYNGSSFNVQDNQDFKERVLESKIPVIVDFHADWCGPCKLLAPRLESLVDAHGEEAHLAKVNIDDNTDLAMEYGVDAVPCVIGFKNGRQVDKFVGVQDEDIIKTFIKKVIGPKV